jgi:hypothetical protein
LGAPSVAEGHIDDEKALLGEIEERIVREEAMKRALPEAVARTDEQLHAERVRGVKWRPIAEVFAAARGSHRPS